jgi:hypothetical protein
MQTLAQQSDPLASFFVELPDRATMALVRSAASGAASYGVQ